MSSQRIVFTGLTAAYGESLWVTDGTAAGTQNITPANWPFYISTTLFGSVGTYVVFQGDDLAASTSGLSGSQTAMFVSNGTVSGTYAIGSVNYSGGLVDFGAKAVFDGSDANGDSGLWVTDGTAVGTQFLTAGTSVLKPSYNGQPDGPGAALNASEAIFADPGYKLWLTNGTAAGTVSLSYSGSHASEFTSFNGKVLFSAEPTGQAGNSLWITDGTAAGTQELTGTDTGNPSAGPVDLAPLIIVDVTPALALMSAATGLTSPTATGGLWRTNGTSAGTVLVSALGGNAITGIAALGTAGKAIVATSTTLYVTDGYSVTAIETMASPSNLTSFNNEVWFTSINSNNVSAVWITDGTAAGTRTVTTPGLLGADTTLTNGPFAATLGAAPAGVPVLSVSSAGFTNAATAVSVSGTIDVADASTPIGIYDGSALLMTLAASSGTWSATVAISAAGTHTLTARASNSAGTGISTAVTDIVSGSASCSGGGEVVLMAQSSASVSLSNTAGTADSVNAFYGFDTINLTAASAAISGGGGDTINFAGGSGNLASLSGTGGTWDYVSGSNGTVSLNSAQAAVTGAGNTIGFAGGSGNVTGLYATAGNWDQVSGSNGTIYLTDAQAAVTGGGDTISFAGGTGNAVGLYGTGGNWDQIWAPGGDTIYLTGAQAAVTGGGDTISFAGGTGNAVGLYGTGGSWDQTWAPGGDTIYLTGAQAAVTGGGDTISFAGGSGNAVGLYGTGGYWDRIWAPGGDTIYLTGAQAAVAGGGDTISFAGGTGNAVGLYSTGGNWDSIWAPGGDTIYLTSAQTAVTGGGDTISFAGGSGNVAGLYSTGGNWDSVWAPGGDTIDLTSAQAAITGGGDTIGFSSGSGNVAGIYNTGGAWDSVWGSGGTIYLTSAQAEVTGSGDAISIAGGSGNAAGLSDTAGGWDSVWGSNAAIFLSSAQAAVTGGGDTFGFLATFGLDTIGGFSASDSMQFSASDFSGWAALSGDMTQSGANTVIALNAANTVTLDNVAMSSLTASQFHFV